MSVALRNKSKRRKLPSVPVEGPIRPFSWVGEEGVTVIDCKVKPDLDRFARLPPHILAQLKEVENDNTILPGQKFIDIPVTTDDFDYDKTTKKGKSLSIQLQRDTFRRIAGVREFADARNSYLVRKVEIRKNPEKSLGFYICEGDGWNRNDGIFVSRLVLGSYIEANKFLQVGDEILKVNEVYVKDFPLSDVALMMQVVEKLVLTVKVLTSVSYMRTYSTISSNTFAAGALSSVQLLSPDTKDEITGQKQQTNNDVSLVHNVEVKEKADPQSVQTDSELPADMIKSSSNGSLLLSISELLDEGYKILDNSELTVDMHNSMTEDDNKNDTQGIDVSPTAVVDLSKTNSSLDQANKNDNKEQTFSEDEDDSDNEDTSNHGEGEEETDFSLLGIFKKKKKARRKKAPATNNNNYEVRKSFWQIQEESIAMEDRIDPIRDMEFTSTTFTGEKADESSNKKTNNDNCTRSISADHNDSLYGVTVMIKINCLLNVSSFTPQNLFCSILKDNVKKASTTIKSVQDTTVEFNEHFYIDFISRPSELQLAICKPAEGGTEEYTISIGTVKLPEINREPEDFSLDISPTGILKIEIQIIPFSQ